MKLKYQQMRFTQRMNVQKVRCGMIGYSLGRNRRLVVALREYLRKGETRLTCQLADLFHQFLVFLSHFGVVLVHSQRGERVE